MGDESLGKAVLILETDERKLMAGLKAAGIEVKGFGDKLDDTGRRSTGLAGMFGGMLQTVAGTAAGFVTAQAAIAGLKGVFSFVGQAAIGMNASLEKSTLQFTTLMGDSDRAAKHVKDLFEFAKKTPFETGPIIEASKSMQTFGGDALNTMENLTLLGDASAATGAPIEDLGFWVGRMYAALQGGQPIGEATMRLMELGVLTPQTRVQMEALAESAGGGQKAFSLFQESIGKFGGAMISQANTWEGLMSSISDAINITLADALKPFFETVKVGAMMVNQALGSEGVQRIFDSLKDKLSGAFGGDSVAIVKGLANSLLLFAEVTTVVAQNIDRAWSAVKLVFAGTASVVNSMMLAVTSSFDQAFQAAAKVPGIGKQFAGVAAEIHLMHTAVKTSQKGFHDMAEEALKGVAGNSTFSKSMGAVRDAIYDMRGELDKSTISTTNAAAAKQQLAQSTDKVIVKTKEQIKAEQDAEKAAEKFAASVKRLDTSEFIVPLKKAVTELGRELEELPSSTKIVEGAFTRLKSGVVMNASEMQKSWDGFRGSITNIGDTILDALKGGGDVLKSVGSSLGAGLGKDLVENFGTKITGALGQTLGGAVNAVIPGLGAMLGPALSLVGSKLKGVFGIGINEEVRKNNAEIEKLRKSLLSTHGSLDVLEAKARAVGMSFMEAWGHQGADGLAAFQGLIDRFNEQWDALQEKRANLESELETTQGTLDGLLGTAEEMGYVFGAQGELVSVTFSKLRSVAKDFGVDLGGLGQTFKQQEMDVEAKRVIDAFTLMSKAAGPEGTGGILVGLKDEISKIVTDSIKLGTTVPKNMEPWILELAKTNQLVDENGEKITDLSTLKFGEPIATEFETISKQIKDGIDKVAELRAAIDAIPTDKTITFTAHYRDDGAPAGFGSGGSTNSGSAPAGLPVYPQAEGGIGRVSKPTLFLAGDKPGGEDYAFSGVGKRFGEGGVSSDALRGEVAGLRADLARRDALFPSLVAAAMRSELQISGVGG